MLLTSPYRILHRLNPPLRIALWYGSFGLAWIFLSDWIVGRLDLSSEQLQTVQTVKGSLFVLASVAVVYVLALLVSRRTEAAHMEAESAYRLLERALGIANATAFMFDRRTSMFELSSGVRRMLGLDSVLTHLDLDDWLNLIHADDRQSFDKSVSDCIARAAPLDVPVRVRIPDGSHRWIRVQGGAIRDADGVPTQVTGTLTDITDVKLAHENLARTVSLIRALARSNHATVVARSEPELFQQVSEALTDETAFSLAWIALIGEEGQPVEIKASSCDRDVPDSVCQIGLVEVIGKDNPIRQAIASGESVYRHDAWADQALAVWRHGDDKRQVGCLVVPFGTNGQISGVLAVFGDLPSDSGSTASIVLHNVGEDIGFAMENLRRRERLSGAEEERDTVRAALAANLLGTVRALAQTVEMRDPYTAGHQERVAELAAAISVELGLGDSEINDLWLGALIHDIGKIYIPAEILNRPGRLSPEEFEIIKPHARKGADILAHVGLPQTVKEVVLHHHERIDGSGYPDGLRGDALSRPVRIVAVADVIEAMAAHRPYRPALGIEAALVQIRKERGTRLDADAVDAACRLFEKKSFSFSGSGASGSWAST